MIETLGKQVTFDENLRNAKVMLTSISTGQKWITIREVLQKRGLEMT